jgi:hypothetical protein
VATVDSVIKQYAQRHEQRLHLHINVNSVVYFLKVHINAVTSYH